MAKMDKVRKAVELLYKDTCSIYTKAEVLDAETHTTSFVDKCLILDEPCRLSFGSDAAAEGGVVSPVSMTPKLFLAPEIIVPAGSRIDVTHEGRTEVYHHSGETPVYPSHQEISLTLEKRYA